MNKRAVLICLSVIGVFCIIASAVCPPCPPCYKSTGKPYCWCVWNCGPCKSCVGGSCVSSCSAGETCCNGSCCGGTCCNGSCCSNANCLTCGASGCESTCDPDACKSCVGGSCVVCGGDPNYECCGGQCIPKCDPDNCMDCNSTSKACESKCDPNETCCAGECCNSGQDCCNNACCDKVWTSGSVSGSTTSCPSCSGFGCSGTAQQVSGYQFCKPTTDGTGSCRCEATEQVVGYTYSCKTNWDCTRILWCAGRGSWCAAVCLFTCPSGSAAACANCLAGASTLSWLII